MGFVLKIPAKLIPTRFRKLKKKYKKYFKESDDFFCIFPGFFDVLKSSKIGLFN